MNTEKTGDKKRLYFLIGGAVALLILALIFSPSSQDVDTVSPQNSAQITSKSVLSETEKSPILEFDLVRVSRGGTGVIAGRTNSDVLVKLFANKELLSESKADKAGEWVFILDAPLKPGTVELSLKGILTDGTEIEAEKVVVISVPEREEKRFLASKESGVVAVMASKDGDGPSVILQKPGVAAFAEVGDSLAIDVIDYGAGKAHIQGRSLARVDLLVYLDAKYIGTVKATDVGTWTLTLDDLIIKSGEHIMRVDQTAGEGGVQMRIEQPFETGIPVDPSRAVNGVIVSPGNTLWHIARKLYGTGVRYTMIFKENSEKIKDPNLIYPGQMFKLPVTKEED